MTQEMTQQREPRPTRSDFRHWSTASTRWADMDGFGHLNNARYFELIATAIDLHLQEAIGGAVDALDQIGLFAEIACGFFRGDADEAAAEGRAVMVYVDNTDAARPAAPLPDVVRTAVEALHR